jgi:hypothetical protein
MTRLLESLVLLAAGALSIWDGWRLSRDERPQALFDVVGPDRYLIGLGVVLAILGLLHMTTALARVDNAGAPDEGTNTRTAFALAGLTILYAAAIAVLGYALATAVFLVAAFKAMAMRSLGRAVLASLAATAVFVVIFVFVADMPLPRGLLF